MARRQVKPGNDELRLPLGMALIIPGLLLLLIGLLLWGFQPVAMPALLQAAAVPPLPARPPVAADLASLPPTRIAPVAEASQPVLIRPPALAPPEEAAGGILLPETPGQSSLPSVATAAEAPRLPYRPPLPGQPTRLLIPAIGVDAPVTAVGLKPVESGGQTLLQWQVPDAPVAGWHGSSARLGEAGNTVLNGHHNVYGELFRDLVKLQVGDAITLYNDQGLPFQYQVVSSQRFLERGQPLAVRLENARWIEPTGDERLTLITCWPYSTNSHRLVVVAMPAAPPVTLPASGPIARPDGQGLPDS